MGAYTLGYSITAMAALFVIFFLALLFVVFWFVMKMGSDCSREEEQRQHREQTQYYFDEADLFKN